MTPEKLAFLIDRYGTALEDWPDTERRAALALLEASGAARTALARARALEALLRLDATHPVTPERVDRVIARTLAVARQMPQTAPPARLWGWLAGLLAVPGDGLWRYGVPAAVALVLGVVVGHATVNRAAPAGAATGIEALLTSFQPVEPFGL